MLNRLSVPGRSTWFTEGYLVSLRGDKIVLEKVDYDHIVLSEASIPSIVPEEYYEINVSAKGNVITVSFEDNELITYEDKVRPFMQGMPGVRTYDTGVSVDEFTVAPIQ